jgi:hypothetical protein
LIAVDLAGDFDRFHEDEVSASVRVRIGDGEGDGFGLGGSEALTFLAEVSFGGDQRLGQVFFDKFAGETGPSGEESGVDSFDPNKNKIFRR